VLGIALALMSALTWGTGDFLGGIAARRFALPWVLAATACGGLLLGGVLSLASGDALPAGRDLALAAIAGVAGVGALAAFYRALAIGTMSIVAPITATGAAIPVLWGVIGRGEQLSPFAVAAIVVAVTGVILASREQDVAETRGVDAATHRLSVILAFVAAAGFGLIFTLIAEAGAQSIYWPAAVLKGATLIVMLAVLGSAGRRRTEWVRPHGLQWLFPLSIGFFDAGANITFAASTHHGPLAITSVVSSLYPVTTVMLAHEFLRERLARSQWIGVVLALAGVAMLAAV
jgi:drug/metabolite transporter (DMT)-like permease